MSSSPKSDLEILAPLSVPIEIGGRIFTQEPLTLRATANLIAAISEEIRDATSTPALVSFMDTDFANVDAVAMLPMFMNLFKGIPDALPRVIALILTGMEDAADMAHVDKYIRPGQFLRVVRTFLEQNDLEELVENFMVLRSMLTEAWSKAKMKTDQA